MTRPQSPAQITALGIIVLPHSQERHARQPSRACAGTWKIHRARPRPPSARVQSNRVSASATLRRNSYFVRLRSPLSTSPAGIMVPTLLQRSPPSLLTTAACGGLRSAPDCRSRRTFLHLSYSCAPPFGLAMLVTQDPIRTWLDESRLPTVQRSRQRRRVQRVVLPRALPLHLDDAKVLQLG